VCLRKFASSSLGFSSLPHASAMSHVWGSWSSWQGSRSWRQWPGSSSWSQWQGSPYYSSDWHSSQVVVSAASATYYEANMQDMTQQEHQEAGAHREATVAHHTFKSGPSTSGVALPAGKGPDGHSGEEARDASAASRPPAAVRSTDGIAAHTKQVLQAPRARFPWELAPFEFRYHLCRKSGPSRHHGRCCPAYQVAAGTTHEASLPNLASTIAGAPSELPDSDMEMTAQESELRAPTPEETTAAAGRPEPTSPLTGGPSAAALRGEGVGSSEAGHSSPPPLQQVT